MNHDYMTGAELQTLREACHLSREELAELCHVKARSIKHWEQGRMGVPADVAELVQRLDRLADELASGMASAGPSVLLRFDNADDLARWCRPLIKMPTGLHGAIVGRARAMLQSQGKPCRVVWMRADPYDDWRQAGGLDDSAATLALWAADQLSAQSHPFRADQPPEAESTPPVVEFFGQHPL